MNTQAIPVKATLPVFIHSVIDDLKLSLEAFRVYCHLARREGKKGAFSSYKAIAEHCFRESFPSASIATLRRKAIAAMNELLEHGLIEKELNQRQDGGNACNTYSVTPLESLQDSVLTPGGGVHRHKVVPMHQGVRSHQHKEGTPYEGTPSEVTPINSPLTPQGELERVSEEVAFETEVTPEEFGNIEPSAESQKPESEFSTQQQSPGGDKSSANSLTGEYQNNCQKFEERFKQRAELLPFEEWENGRVGGRKQFKAGFVEAWRQYLSTTPRYAKDLRREASTGEAKASILNTSRSPEGKEMLLARWESFEELRQQKEKRNMPTDYQQYEIVDEVRLAILKKRQAQAVGTA
jgi:hypothetical protein